MMTFENWFNEQEGFGLRSERIFWTFPNITKDEKTALTLWLNAAYNVGYDKGAIDQHDSESRHAMDPSAV